jgi:7-cyano-7-deazaguanine synthase
MVSYDVLILCSGGLDSVVMTHELLNQGYKCRLFYGNYGKKTSSREIASVKQVSLNFGLPIEFVDLKGTTDLQAGYVSIGILNREELDVGIVAESDEGKVATLGRPDGLYITGIYSMLSVASYAAQLTNINKIAVAVTKEQLDTHPTLRDALDAWEKCVQLFNPQAGEFKVLSPLIDKTKAEIVSLGTKLEVPLERTWSCTQSGGELPCGECSQCLHRKEAFSLAGIEDKTIYMNP